MFGNIARIVQQFQQSWSRELEDDAIKQACAEAGHTWRERELGPVATVKLFLVQILFGNVACEFVPHLAGKRVTGSAYCTARGRLPAGRAANAPHALHGGDGGSGPRDRAVAGPPLVRTRRLQLLDVRHR